MHASQEFDRSQRVKERLGAFIYHPVIGVAIVTLILVSVALVAAHLLLPEDDPRQHPIEQVQLFITALFIVELTIKGYVAPSRARFFGQYWVDIIAVIPWAQSLRVLRILRLLRVFRVALVLSRRISFVSALFRSAIGEYVVLGLIMIILLGIGTLSLYVSEARARTAEDQRRRLGVDRALAQIERELRLPVHDAAPSWGQLHERLELVQRRLEDDPAGPPAQAHRSELPALAARIREGTTRVPAVNDLAEFENSFWATVFFLVATEPMVDVPRTTAGRAIVLIVMFGGLTTFAIFTGIITALMVNRLKRRGEIDDMDRFQLNDHFVICGWNRLVPLILAEITETRGVTPSAIVVLADLEEPPPEIVQHTTSGRVFFVRGDYTKPEFLDQARIRHAKTAIIVADTTIVRSDQDRDARTVLASLMIERMRPGIYTCAELLNRDNEPHLRAAGIEEVIVTSEAGGHHLALAALHAGLADVLSELVTARVGDTLIKLPVPESYVGEPFAAAMTRFKQERDAILIGLEVRGRDGPESQGYAMLINPKTEVVLGERDNLVAIATTKLGAKP